MTQTDYTIETVDLVKRYPTSSKQLQERGHPPPPPGGHPPPGGGFGGPPPSGDFFKILRGAKGPYIEALRGVNLKVKRGEILGILGPNGAGKTTLIKILCTLVIHDEGSAYVCGVDVKKEPKKVLKVLQAVLPESRGFNWRLTGKQNLDFYALLYGLNDQEAAQRIKSLLEFTGLDTRADDPIQRYSTGMQRKLLLCRALLRNTPVLLFDEPTVGLDPRAAAEFRIMLHDKLAREEGKTILFSTHNLDEAQAACDRIAILDHGKITVIDTPDNLRSTMTEGFPFTIAFHDAIYDDASRRLVMELEKMDGVQDVRPEADHERNLRGLIFRVAKGIDLSSILTRVVASGLKIKAVNTQEPTLEEAFRNITKQNPAGPPDRPPFGPPPFGGPRGPPPGGGFF